MNDVVVDWGGTANTAAAAIDVAAINDVVAAVAVVAAAVAVVAVAGFPAVAVLGNVGAVVFGL